jgi:hypothetical protein
MARNMGRMYHCMEEHVKEKHPKGDRQLMSDMLDLRQLGMPNAEIVSLKS